MWRTSQLVFLHLNSDQTVENLHSNPAIEINVVDPIVRRGFRFKGTATVLESGSRHDAILEHYERNVGTDVSRVRAAVVVEVAEAAPVSSPAYDVGLSDGDIRSLARPSPGAAPTRPLRLHRFVGGDDR